jgi:hypothetical protein
MYGNPPLFLPPSSNREDLLLTFSIFDDDTGDPINLSGTVTAAGTPFTGNNWTISVGAISQTYTGVLIIPAPPINNELSAVNIAFLVGQNIKPGAPVKIADPSGQNYMLGFVTSYNPQTGAMVVQIGNTFQFEIRRQAPRDNDMMWGGYWPFGGTGVVNNEGPLIRAGLGTGVTIIDVGYIQVLIPEAQLRSILYLATFGAYMTMSDSINTRQVFIANLPVLYGGVTT